MGPSVKLALVPPREGSPLGADAREVLRLLREERCRAPDWRTALKVGLVAGFGGTATTVRSRFRAIAEGAVWAPDGPLPR
ncbi:MAG TPA: hypothetical protein DCE10_03640 [Acidimicrobiaceae bacterium]|nr:hypothetical protein [Acidimicrobiaceae bacterium]